MEVIAAQSGMYSFSASRMLPPASLNLICFLLFPCTSRILTTPFQGSGEDNGQATGGLTCFGRSLAQR